MLFLVNVVVVCKTQVQNPKLITLILKMHFNTLIWTHDLKTLPKYKTPILDP